MCNRLQIPSDLKALFREAKGPIPNTNVTEMYPGYYGPVARREARDLIIETMRWGFPTYAPGKRDPSKTITTYWTNARNLTASLWRNHANKAENRCLVPVSEFAEPDSSKGKGGNTWFGMADGRPFAFAGIWKPTQEGPHYAFLTCPPNEIVGPIHPKAMPVIVGESDWDSWLSGTPAEEMQRPYPAELMRIVA